MLRKFRVRPFSLLAEPYLCISDTLSDLALPFTQLSISRLVPKRNWSVKKTQRVPRFPWRYRFTRQPCGVPRGGATVSHKRRSARGLRYAPRNRFTWQQCYFPLEYSINPTIHLKFRSDHVEDELQLTFDAIELEFQYQPLHD